MENGIIECLSILHFKYILTASKKLPIYLFMKFAQFESECSGTFVKVSNREQSSTFF